MSSAPASSIDRSTTNSPVAPVFRGEGRLTLAETLGGRSVLGVVGVGLVAVIAFAWPRHPSDWTSWLPMFAGAMVPLWFAHRTGLLRALLSVVRGAPRARWCVELDELGVRHVEDDGSRSRGFDWFEIERYDVTALGLVLWLRLPKDGVNAFLLVRRFFPAEQWPALLELVRAKLPGSARAHDAAAATAAAKRKLRWRPFLLWLALVGLSAAVWYALEPR